jgi:hypothetical protein
MNDQTTKPEYAVALTVDEAEQLHHLREAARKHKQTRLNMPLLKFTKGDFVLGKDKENVSLGTEFVALVLEARHGVECWDGRERTAQNIGRVASSFKVEDVERLNAIERMSDEKPWRHVVCLPLVTADGRDMMLFKSSSAGGRYAFYHLIDQYVPGASRRPSKVPRIALGSSSYESKKYGRIQEPTFTIVGWDGVPDIAALVGATVDTEQRNDGASFAGDTTKKPRDEMDDEIPF